MMMMMVFVYYSTSNHPRIVIVRVGIDGVIAK
jgi:hypothetical protein